MPSYPPPKRPDILPRGHVALPPEVVAASHCARFIAAMTEVVGRQGFRATTLADLTPVARISRSDFYEHYDNLEACLAAAFDAGAERLLTAASETDTPDAALPTRAERALAAAFALLASEPGLARLLFAEFLPREPSNAERYRIWARRLLGLLPATAAPGSDAAQRPDPAALGGIVSVLGEAALRDPTRLPELAPELTAFLTASHGFGASSTAPSPLAAELAAPRELPAAPDPPVAVAPSDPLDMDAHREFSRLRTRADQHQRLLAAAVEIITTRGCAKLTIHATAGAAGVAPQALRDLFGGREGILAATFDVAAERLLDTLDAIHRPQDGFADQVEAGLRAALDLFADDPTLATLLTVDFLPSSEALPDRYHRLLWRLAARLRHAATERALPAPSPLIARATVGGLVAAIAVRVEEGEIDRLLELVEPLAAWVVSLQAGSAPAP